MILFSSLGGGRLEEKRANPCLKMYLLPLLCVNLSGGLIPLNVSLLEFPIIDFWDLIFWTVHPEELPGTNPEHLHHNLNLNICLLLLFLSRHKSWPSSPLFIPKPSAMVKGKRTYMRSSSFHLSFMAMDSSALLRLTWRIMQMAMSRASSYKDR